MKVQTDSERVRHSRKLVLELLASSVDLSTTPVAPATSSATTRARALRPAGAAGSRSRPQAHRPSRRAGRPDGRDRRRAGQDRQRALRPRLLEVHPLLQVRRRLRRAVPEHVRDRRRRPRLRRPHLDRVRRRAARVGVRLLRQLHRRLPDRRADVPAPSTSCAPAGDWREDEQTVTDTICPYCGVGCNLDAPRAGQPIVKVTCPDDHDVTRGNLCIKGRFGFQHVQASGTRKAPMPARCPTLAAHLRTPLRHWQRVSPCHLSARCAGVRRMESRQPFPIHRRPCTSEPRRASRCSSSGTNSPETEVDPLVVAIAEARRGGSRAAPRGHAPGPSPSSSEPAGVRVVRREPVLGGVDVDADPADDGPGRSPRAGRRPPSVVESTSFGHLMPPRAGQSRSPRRPASATTSDELRAGGPAGASRTERSSEAPSASSHCRPVAPAARRLVLGRRRPRPRAGRPRAPASCVDAHLGPRGTAGRAGRAGAAPPRPGESSRARSLVLWSGAASFRPGLARRFDSSRRSRDATVGRVGTRRRSTRSASASFATSRSTASSRFLAWLRSSCATARSTGPAFAITRRFCAA